MSFKVLVCGGRDFANAHALFYYLDYLNATRPITCIVHGGAKGADTLAGQWAQSRNVSVEVYPAEWKKYGKAAGPMRNKRMLEEAKPNYVVAFPGGPGTKNMVRLAREAGVLLWEVDA